MNGEIPLQYDLLTGDLVDTRSDHQKRLDKDRQKPQQQQLFSSVEVAQMSANARPWLNDAPSPKLTLEVQDVRTDEERESALMKAAEELTEPLFAEPLEANPTSIVGGNELISDEPMEYRVALFHLGKAELIESRADLSHKIERLKDTDIEAIALEAEEALRSVYAMVLNITLTSYLMRSDKDYDKPTSSIYLSN